MSRASDLPGRVFTFRLPAPEHILYGEHAFQNNVGKRITVGTPDGPLAGVLTSAVVYDDGTHVHLTILLLEETVP